LRACARIALFSVALLGGFGLAGCASIEELKDTMSGWFATGNSLGGHEGVSPDDVPDASHIAPPEKPPREEASKASKNKDKPARKLQRPQTAELPKQPPVSAPTEAVKSQGANAQSASSQAAPSRLRNLWPEPPAPGTFSR
jgi:hypothetical protein